MWSMALCSIANPPAATTFFFSPQAGSHLMVLFSIILSFFGLSFLILIDLDIELDIAFPFSDLVSSIYKLEM